MGLLEMSTDCFICNMSEVAPDQLPAHDKPVASDRNFVAFPALGQFIEGYLLLSPRQHVLNMGLLSGAETEQFQRFKDKIRRLLSTVYKPPIFFEHGAISPATLPPCCQEHAHLHAIPMTLIEPPAAVTETLRGKQITSYDEVRRRAQAKQPYFYLQLSDGKQYLYEAGNLPSQFGRRVMAELLGIPDEWDWAVFPHYDNIEKTYRKLNSGEPINDVTDQSLFRTAH